MRQVTPPRLDATWPQAQLTQEDTPLSLFERPSFASFWDDTRPTEIIKALPLAFSTRISVGQSRAYPEKLFWRMLALIAR